METECPKASDFKKLHGDRCKFRVHSCNDQPGTSKVRVRQNKQNVCQKFKQRRETSGAENEVASLCLLVKIFPALQVDRVWRKISEQHEEEIDSLLLVGAGYSPQLF